MLAAAARMPTLLAMLRGVSGRPGWCSAPPVICVLTLCGQRVH
jgi:hypothetical protein